MSLWKVVKVVNPLMGCLRLMGDQQELQEAFRSWVEETIWEWPRQPLAVQQEQG